MNRMNAIKMPVQLFSMALLCAGMFVIVFAIGREENQQQTKQSPPGKGRQMLVEKQFNPFDGSHLELTRIIKKAMRNPASYRHIQTRYSDMQDYIVVKTVYSSEYGQGCRIKSFVKAKFDEYGNLLEVMDAGLCPADSGDGIDVNAAAVLPDERE